MIGNADRSTRSRMSQDGSRALPLMVKITVRSSLRRSRLAHAVIHTIPSGEIGGIVTRHGSSEATDSPGGIERKSRLHGGPRLAELAKQRQGGGEEEMATCEIAVGV